MADNTRGGSNDATLPLIATDDVGGVQYQRVKLDVGGDGASSPVTSISPLPVSLAEGTVVDINNTPLPVTVGNTVDVAVTNAVSVTGSTVEVTGIVDGSIIAVPPKAATGTLTTVADNASSVTILASNANRIKALITNDSSARLYLRFAASAASTSNYGVSLAQHETWEEWHYTGEIRGIWASDPGDGAARVTEFT